MKNNTVHQESIKSTEAVVRRQDRYFGSAKIVDCFQKIKLQLAAAYGKDSSIF